MITKQTFRPSTLQGLFHILTSKVQLEDRVLTDIMLVADVREEFQSIVQAQACIEMHGLERLRITDATSDDTLTVLLNPKIIPGAHQWTRYYKFTSLRNITPGSLASMFAPRHCVPVQMAATDETIAATDR